jgi:hypothetical protein
MDERIVALTPDDVVDVIDNLLAAASLLDTTAVHVANCESKDDAAAVSYLVDTARSLNYNSIQRLRRGLVEPKNP